MIWDIPRMWKDGECWIIGGGPSMPYQFGVPENVIQAVYNKEQSVSAFSPHLSPIHGKHVIGVNIAYKIGRWIDIVFYGDGGFYWKNKNELRTFPNLKVTCNPNTNPRRPGVINVKYVLMDKTHPMGITTKRNMVSWNMNSGAAAINFAYHLGVKRIYLLGFDMKLSGDALHQHWHAEYIAKTNNALSPRRLPFKRHLSGFTPIANDARKLGLEIINVNPDSAIVQFPRVKLEDVLR